MPLASYRPSWDTTRRRLIQVASVAFPLVVVWLLASDGIVNLRDPSVFLRATWTLVTMYGVEIALWLLILAVGDYQDVLKSRLDGPLRAASLGNIRSHSLVLVLLLSSCIAGLASYIPSPWVSLSGLIVNAAAGVALAVQLLISRRRVRDAVRLARSKRAQQSLKKIEEEAV